MTNEQPNPEKLPTDVPAGSGEDAAKSQPSSAEAPAAIGQPAPVNTLTPEEQMALFEKELKENDWGHQPC